MKIVINCLAGQPSFGLQAVAAFSRTYQATGTLTTNPITLKGTSAQFSTVEQDFGPYSTITHQVSTDGVSFNVVSPGTIPTSSPFWYRALLSRSASAFNQQQSPLVPLASTGTSNQPYTLKSQNTVTLSSGIIEQTLVLANITGAVSFQNLPLPGTFRIQVGSTFLTLGQDYTLSGNTLTFSAAQALATITYQTSALGAASFAGLQNYYTPLLYEARFRAV